MNRKATVLLIILVLVLSLVVGFLWLEIKQARQLALLPVFSKQHSVVAGEIDWQLKNFQPIIKGFESKNGQNLVRVEFIDQNNRQKQANLFVSGKTPSGYQIKEIVFEQADGSIEKLDFKQLRKRLKKGRQVRVKYINTVPKLLDTTACQKLAENFQGLCFLTDILAGQTISQVEDVLKTGKDQIVTVPVTYLSWKLYEN